MSGPTQKRSFVLASLVSDLPAHWSTVLELCGVAAVVAILTALSFHGMQYLPQRAAAVEALSLSAGYRVEFIEHRAATGRWPSAEQVMRVPYEDMSGSRVAFVETPGDGVIVVRFRDPDNARFQLAGQLSVRGAAMSQDAATVVWVCGDAPFPEQFDSIGNDATDLMWEVRPFNCRKPQ